MLLWLVVFSTLVKVAVQIEMARYSIATVRAAWRGTRRSPFIMILIGGIADGIFLVGVAVAAYYLRSERD